MFSTIFRRVPCITVMFVSAALVFAAGCASVVSRPRQTASPEEIEAKKQAIDLFVAGKTAEAKGNRDTAISLYFEARQYDPQSSEIAVALAKAFLGTGKTLSAIHFARIAHAIDPTNTDALSLLQYLFQQTGNIEAAAEALRLMIKLTPNPDISLFYRLAQYQLVLDRPDRARRILLDRAHTPNRPREELADIAAFFDENEMYDDAAELYTMLVKSDPSDVDSWAALGDIEARTGKNLRAEETLRKALAANPENTSLVIALGNNCMARNEWDCAIRCFEKARSGGIARTKLLSTLTALYYYANRPSNAEALRDSVIAAGEDDAQFYIFLGKAMIYRLDYATGVEYFRKGFEKPLDLLSDDQKLNAYLGYVQCLVRTGKSEEALRVIQEEAVQNIKDPQYAKDIEASVYMEMKRYDDAAAIYSWLMDAEPENPRHLIALTQAYNSAGKYAESEKILRTAIDDDPENTRFLMQLGIVYDLMKDSGRAEETLLQVIKLEPENALALNNLAYLYIDSGRNLKKAILMTKRALKIDPGNGAYLDTMGWGFYKKGDIKKAREYVEKALEKAEPQDKGVILDHHGDILSRLGMKEEAKAAYREAVTFGEDEGKMSTKIEGLNK